MKKNAKKILVLVITVAVAVLALAGIVYAATRPSVDVAYINISYGIRTELKYAVKANSLPSGAEIGIEVAVGSPNSGVTREAKNQGYTTIKGERCLVFGLPIYADEMTVDFYAKPYIKNGSEIIYGDLEKDSIIEYAVRKSATLGGDDPISKLLDALLDYGASAQMYCGENTHRLANADFYRIELVGAEFSDGFSYGYFSVGETVSAVPVLASGYTVERWTDSTGKTVSTENMLSVVAPAKNETYTVNTVKSGENISYVLDGGTLPSGNWTQYPESADYTLPTPTKEGYVFAGWYTDPGFALSANLSKIPAGSTDYFTLYAKWNKIVLSGDAAYLKSNLKTLCFVYDNAETYGGNGNALEIEGDALVWTQGSVKTSQITLHKGIKKLIGDSGVFTFEFEIAKKAGEELFDSTIRLRRQGKNETVNIFKITKDGNVSIAGGDVIATLTENFTKIRITVDVLNGTISTYDANGQLVTSSKFGVPSSVTSYSEWYDLLTDVTWQWLANSQPSSGTSAIRIKSMRLIEGNPDVRGTGIPVTLVGEGANAYKVVYDTDSAIAEGAADKFISYARSLGLKAPAKVGDTTAASVNEIVFGNTDRADNAEVKAVLDALVAKNPDNHSWAGMYKGGKLYVMANSEYGYAAALAYVKNNFGKGDKIAVGSEFVFSETYTKDDALIASLVDPEPHDAYMSYDVPDNYYDAYSNDFGVKESELVPMTISYVDAKTYRISYSDSKSGGTYTVDIVQKQWGCWMLGAIVYTDKDGKANGICPGSTDYEFVLRCGNETDTAFRGGNHANFGDKDAYDPNNSETANDRLLDMTFYDGKTGARITLPTANNPVTATGVRIVMHTNIYEQGYAQENVLMNVCKDYLINGFDVFCHSNLYMTQGVNFATSYSCMLPIMKAYGNNAIYYNRDGSNTYFKTVQSGGSDENNRGHDSTLVDLWGDNYPQYHMQVEIMNPDVQLMKSDDDTGYASFRNMLGGKQNKVYFSFGSENVRLEKGTELDFVNRWSFYIDEDFTAPTTEPDYWVGLPKS